MVSGGPQQVREGASIRAGSEGRAGAQGPTACPRALKERSQELLNSRWRGFGRLAVCNFPGSPQGPQHMALAAWEWHWLGAAR